MTMLAAQPASTLLPGASVFEQNLAALSKRSPRAAEQVRRASPREGLKWTTTDQPGAWSADLDGRALASKRRPVDEAEKLAGSVDFKQVGAAVVLGFGLGYHVAALTRRAGGHSMVLVYEPDVSLLRSVLEHAEIAEWLREGRVMVFTDAGDGATINASLTGLEALIGLGVTIVEHPASKPRLGDSGLKFTETLTRVVAACRTQVVTTMTQMEVTVRNFLMNADHYAGLTGAGALKDLKDAAKGMPAVVVSAGPSLERNLHLLGEPGVRDRCVIIAVQTVLKPMLARGIKPHFVTALDFHEISRRFYEGLTKEDVEGVTLVVEPKANAAILSAFPGAIRVAGAETLDVLLGPELAGDHGVIPAGATVAHLAYYLARYLGCDPVMLIGQDLAFTDGQYYAAGAAIHDVWATELNPFNTLETMEWQRIVRWRGHLHHTRDHLDRPVYIDDQMATYLAQFERDFLADQERGLTTIDATEGGARKAHTKIMALREALEKFRGSGFVVQGLGSPSTEPQGLSRDSLRNRFRKRIESVRQDARAIEYLSREAVGLLTRMSELGGDESRINPLIDRVHALKEQVQSKQAAYNLVHRLNQAGAYKRLRADRALGLDEGLTPVEKQSRQIERDIMNVTWLADAARSLDELLGATLASLDGAPKRTRDPVAESDLKSDISDLKSDSTRIAAVIPVDFERSALGTPRDLGRMIDGRNLLQRTVDRLRHVPGLDGVILLSSDPERARALLGEWPGPLGVHVMPVGTDALRATAASVAAARLWAPTCWRGGIAGMTCYDEVYDPSLVAAALVQHDYSSALILGPDWCEIDPALCGEVMARHRENPRALPFTFTQAPPGLAGCVIGLELTRKLAAGREAGDPTATLGGLLGFKPTRPRRDPIAESCCIQIAPEVRSLQRRFIADEVSSSDEHFSAAAPAHLIIELIGSRDATHMAKRDAERLLNEFARSNPRGVVTFAGRGDPLDHAELTRVIASARSAGIAGVHVRTSAAGDEAAIDALIEAQPDVISVDLHATSESTYATLTGTPHFQRALLNTQRLLDARRFVRGLPHPWIVPRIRRCDAVYEEVEGFYDRAIFFACAGVIDPMPCPIPGDRIAPLPKPRGTLLRDASMRMLIRCDGAVITDETDIETLAQSPAANALTDGLLIAWRRLMDRRRAAWRDHGHAHPDLRTM